VRPTSAVAPTGHATATAAPPAGASGPHARHGLGFVFVGGLLAVGIAFAATSSAGGGHAPSSTTAATTSPFRLVAPVLLWRMRALAERVRPAPLVFPLELPG
jgi:hypothetical protein